VTPEPRDPLSTGLAEAGYRTSVEDTMFDASPRPELLTLLAAVKAEPEDDTAKLVLADWLEEQDHEADRARGEYLREAVRYHRMDAADPTRTDVLGRLDSLWQRHSGEWLGPLPAAGFRFWGHASRSWLLTPLIDGTQLVARAATGAAGSEAYAWVGGLTFDRLTDPQFGEFLSGPLSDSLIALAFDGCNVGPAAFAGLAESPKAGSLKSLAVLRVPARAGAFGRSRSFAGLRTLRFQNAEIGDAGFKELCDSPHLNELRSLEVSGDALSIHSARAFADAAGLPALTELNIGGTNRIGPDGTLILVHKPAAGRLRKLNLWSNGVADYGVEAICRAPHMCNLTHLDASGNLLTSRAAVAIAAAEHLKTLEELNLRTNGISGEGALALAGSPHLTNLRRLDLGGNAIGAKAAARLRERFGSRVVLD
jgi:uncharacterized protein (TIGR02996 family)